MRSSLEQPHHCHRSPVLPRQQAISSGESRFSAPKGRVQPRFLQKPAVHMRMNSYKMKYWSLPLQNQFMSDRRRNAKTDTSQRAQEDGATEPERSGGAQGSFTQAAHPRSFPATTDTLRTQTTLKTITVWQMRRGKKKNKSVNCEVKRHYSHPY